MWSCQQLMIVGRVALEAGIAVDDIAEVVAERCEVALDGLGLEMADVLMVDTPSSTDGFGDEHMEELLAVLDAECEELPARTLGTTPVRWVSPAELRVVAGSHGCCPVCVCATNTHTRAQ